MMQEVNQKPEFLTHPIAEQSPLHTHDVVYGGRIDVMRVHYKLRENETIQNVAVMSLYPCVCKYLKWRRV